MAQLDQWGNSYEISASELLPGDLGFLMNDDGQGGIMSWYLQAMVTMANGCGSFLRR